MDIREQVKLLEVLEHSPQGILKPAFTANQFWALRCVPAPGITIHYRSGYKRPYQVMWWVSGDREVAPGCWKGETFLRTRCFKKIDSLFKFLEELI